MRLSQEYLNILVQQHEKIYKFSFNFGAVSFCSVQGLVKNNINDGMGALGSTVCVVFLVPSDSSSRLRWIAVPVSVPHSKPPKA